MLVLCFFPMSRMHHSIRFRWRVRLLQRIKHSRRTWRCLIKYILVDLQPEHPQIIFFPVLEGMFSTEVIVRWETENKCNVSDKKHKSKELKQLIRKCGLSTSMSVPKMRTVLLSLKRNSLPICSAEVDRVLMEHNQALSGTFLDTGKS